MLPTNRHSTAPTKWRRIPLRHHQAGRERYTWNHRCGGEQSLIEIIMFASYHFDIRKLSLDDALHPLCGIASNRSALMPCMA